VSYHDLSDSTLTDDERRIEANRICERLQHEIGAMKDNEKHFIQRKMRGGYVSIKEIFWLRNLNEKY
jgi:hypothetical protein